MDSRGLLEQEAARANAVYADFIARDPNGVALLELVEMAAAVMAASIVRKMALSPAEAFDIALRLLKQRNA